MTWHKKKKKKKQLERFSKKYINFFFFNSIIYDEFIIFLSILKSCVIEECENDDEFGRNFAYSFDIQELNFNSNINSRCIVLRFVDFYFFNNYRIEGCFTWKYESGWNEISLVIIFQELNINFRNVYIIFFVRSFYLSFIFIMFLLSFPYFFDSMFTYTWIFL